MATATLDDVVSLLEAMNAKTTEGNKKLEDISRVQKLMVQSQRDGNDILSTADIMFEEVGGAVKELDVTSWGKLVDPLLKMAPQIVGTLPDITKLVPIMAKIIPQIPKLGAPLGNVIAVMSMIDAGVMLINSIIEQIPAIIVEAVNSLVNTFVNIVGGIYQIAFKIPLLLLNFFTELPKILINVFLQVFTMFVKLATTFVTTIIKIMMAIPMMIISSIAEILTTVVEALMNAVMEIADLVMDFIGTFVKMGFKIVFALFKFFAFIPMMLVKVASKFLAMMFDLLAELVSEFMSFIIETILAVPIIMVKGITKVLTAIFDIGDMVMDMIEGVIKTIFKAIFAIPILIVLFKKIFSSTGVEFVKTIGKMVTNIFSSLSGMLMPILEDVMKSFIEYFPAIAEEMTKIGLNIGGQILKSFSKLGDMFFSSGPFKMFNGLWVTIRDFATKLIGDISSWLAKLMAIKPEDRLKFIAKSMEGMVGTLWDFIKDPLAQLLKGIWDYAWPMIDVALTRLIPAVGEAMANKKQSEYKTKEASKMILEAGKLGKDTHLLEQKLDEIANVKNRWRDNADIVEQNKKLQKLIELTEQQTKEYRDKRISTGGVKLPIPSPAL